MISVLPMPKYVRMSKYKKMEGGQCLVLSRNPSEDGHCLRLPSIVNRMVTAQEYEITTEYEKDAATVRLVLRDHSSDRLHIFLRLPFPCTALLNLIK